MRCNCCGVEIKKENDILMEDVCAVKKEWGYFSGKDCEVHNFILCERCYDKITSGFKIPISINEKLEVLD